MTTNKDMLSLLKADEEFQELQQWFLQKQNSLEASTSCDQCMDHREDKSTSEQKSVLSLKILFRGIKEVEISIVDPMRFDFVVQNKSPTAHISF